MVRCGVFAEMPFFLLFPDSQIFSHNKIKINGNLSQSHYFSVHGIPTLVLTSYINILRFLVNTFTLLAHKVKIRNYPSYFSSMFSCIAAFEIVCVASTWKGR